MKTVVLSGYYGFNNAGDEALLAAIAGTLREQDSELNLVVLSAAPKQTDRQHRIKAVSRVNPVALVRTMWRADLLISGGGSLLQDVTSWRSIIYYLGIVTLGLLLGTPVMFYAQGIGPIRRGWTRWLTRVIANRVQLITVRDEDSRRELQALGVTRPPILVTADPVLGMSRLSDEKCQPYFPECKITVPGGRIGFALRNWKGLTGFKIAAAEAADYFCQQGFEVIFIPFHYPDDLEAALEVTELMRCSAQINQERNSVWAVMQEIRQLDLLIGMRLHSLIFAAAQGVPLLGIAYDPKVTGFLEQLGEKPVGQVEDLTAERLIQGVNALIERLPAARAELQLESARLGELARENARLALALLAGTKNWREGTPESVPSLGGQDSPGFPALESEKAADSAPSPGEQSETDRSRVTVLGAQIDRLDMQQALKKIMEYISSGEPRQVITLNAEIIYQAQQQLELLQLINQADLVTPDGAGVVWASRYLGQPVPERVTGIDLLLALGPVAEVKGYRLFLLGSAPGVAEEAGQKLQELYPKLNIVGTYHGYFPPGSDEEQHVLQMIRQAQPDLLLVALGAPRQEFWIRQHRAAGNLTVPVSIGIGGSLDVIAGRVERAPAWMRRFQLEWLGRLVREPRRWRRMLALPKFVVKVLTQSK